MNTGGTLATCRNTAQQFQARQRRDQEAGESRSLAAAAAATRFRRRGSAPTTARPPRGRNDAQRLLEDGKLRRAALAHRGAGQGAGDLREAHDRAKRLRAVVADAEVV